MKTKKKSVKTASSRSVATKRPVTMSSTSAMAAAVSNVSTTRPVSSSEQELTPLSFLSMAFVAYFIAEVIIVYVASMIFPQMIVLGTNMVSPFMALLYSMGVLTLIVVGAMPVIEMLSRSAGIKLKDMHWMLIYFVINTLSLWMIGRFAEILGLGLSSWMVVVALAFVINAVQGVITVTMMSKSKK